MKNRWRFTDAIESWSWQGCEGKKAVVEVFSDADSIRLYLNGQLIGRQKVRQCKTRFVSRYQPGTLEAVALDRTGHETGRSLLITGGDETLISLKPEKARLRANGQDLCFIPVTLTDKNGTCKPAKDVRIHVDVEGPGVLQGLGSALCKTDEVFHESYHDTYYGRALAVVRTGYQAGRIRVTVSAEGFATQVIEIEVDEFDMNSPQES